MGNLTTALTIVLAINCMFILGNVAVNDLLEDNVNFYSCEGSVHSELGTCNLTSGEFVLNTGNSVNLLPTGEATSVNQETGNIFTDIFSSTKTWLLDTMGLSYVVQILSTPYDIMIAIGLPSAFAFAVGSLWYGVTLLLIVAFIFGRDS